MPFTALIANGFWVLVIGLMGPSVPFIIDEFSLDYSQAGLIFTILSIAACFGTFAGGWVSDYRHRKVFWLIFMLMLSVGLLFCGLASSFIFLLLMIFIMSLFGSPIGAVGQSILLQLYPEKRGFYVSLTAMVAAIGSLLAPLLISAMYAVGLSWRAAFFTIAAFALVLFMVILRSKLPEPAVTQGSKLTVFKLFADKRILFVGLIIFFCVGIDLGFSYWLAEYFVTNLGAAAEISGLAVGSYLLGIIIGRLLNSHKPESLNPWVAGRIGLGFAIISLIIFLNIESLLLKSILCFIYGLGVGPIFPLMMSTGTALYPERSGAVTAILFSLTSLSGAIFPVVIGFVGNGRGIEVAYYSIFIIMIPIAVGLFTGRKMLKRLS